MIARMGHGAFPEARPLAERIEIEVRAQIEECDVAFGIRGSAGQDVSSHELLGEFRFPSAGGATAIEIVPEKREDLWDGKGLEGVGDLASGLRPDGCQHFAIAANRGEIDHVGWRGQRHERQCA